MNAELVFNFESPQTEILGNCALVYGCKFIVINLTAHNLLYGYSEDELVEALTRTITHEVIHDIIMDFGESNHEFIVSAMCDYIFHPIPDHSKYIEQRERYKIEGLAGYA